MGTIHLHRGVPSEAVGELKKSLELSPANPIATANLGFALMLMRNWTEAKASLQQALSMDSQLTQARNNLGIVLANLGDYDGALAQMQQVGGTAAAYNNLGVILLIYLKQPSAAAEAFEEALRYDPNYEKARQNLTAALALMPPSTVVQLPPVKAPARLSLSAVVDISETTLPITELLTPGKTVFLPHQPEAVEYTANPSGSTATEEQAGGSVVPVNRPLKTVLASRLHDSNPTKGEPEAPHRADQRIRIYELLGTFGVILVTAVISRRILSRMAVLQRCS
jgi:tetratricopeptide (TPR) repeat protein